GSVTGVQTCALPIYYPASQFPDPVSSLVDAERAAQFEEEGAHFESAYYLTFVFLPPAEEAARAESFLYEGVVSDGSIDAHQILKIGRASCRERVEDL